MALMGVPLAVGADAVLPWDPENVPGDGWPGRDAEESNAAWPTGQQPASLVAWEMDDDRPEPCWKVTVLHDTALGWPGQCDGLDRVTFASEEECEASCRRDPTCGVWQFTNFSECFHGQGFYCDDGGGRAPVAVRRAQRLLHGDIRVMKDMTGWDVFKLRNLGVWRTGNVTDGVLHCRNYCYSQIYCQYWQYGEGGCYVEDPRSEFIVMKEYEVQYPLTTNGGATQDSNFARTGVAAEYIQHICPARLAPTTTVAPAEVLGVPVGVPVGALEGEVQKRWQLVGGISALVAAISLCACARRCSEPGQGELRKKTRSHSVDLLQPEEDEEVASDRSVSKDHEVPLGAVDAVARQHVERQPGTELADLQERRPPGGRAVPFSYMPLDTRPPLERMQSVALPVERMQSVQLAGAQPALRLAMPGVQQLQQQQQVAVPAGAPIRGSATLPAPKAPTPRLQPPTLPVPRLPILQTLQLPLAAPAPQDPAPQALRTTSGQVPSSSVSLPPRQRPQHQLRFYSFH